MAANPERGEVDLVVGEKTYTLRPTMNTLCILQKRTGQTYAQILQSLSSLDLANMRELLFTLLQPNHAKEIRTLDQAGDLIDTAGGFGAVLRVMTELMAVNDRRARASDGGDADADPQTAQAGTGDNSGATPDASA